MRDKVFSLDKLKVLILLFIILGLSIIVLSLSNMGTVKQYTADDGHVVNYKKYLYTPNYIAMGLLLLFALYFFVCLVYSVAKQKNYPKSLLITNIILFVVLAPITAMFSSFRDMIGLHIDMFLGYLFLYLGIINFIIFAINKSKKK